MRGLLGSEYDAFLAALEQEPSHGLRWNRLKTGADGQNAAERFGALSGSACPFAQLSPVPWAEDGCYYPSSLQPGRHPFHEAGLYYIQEPSAMAAAELLKVRPGERILDLCAAPGGKSAQLAAKLGGRGFLLCNEIHPVRARILSENMERMGVGNAIVTNESPGRLAERFPAYFDRILVDAPCSGEGMFRKNPQACAQWSPENVTLCAERQDEILDCAEKMLRAGGRLVYSTCTFAPEENEGSVSRFLRRHPDFDILPVSNKTAMPVGCDGVPEWGDKNPKLADTLRLWPHKVRGEGHFAAVLQKAGETKGKGSVVSESGTVRGLSERELGELGAFVRENLRLPGGEDGYGESLLRRIGRVAGLGEECAGVSFGENLYLVPAQAPHLRGMRALRPGLHLGERKKNRFEPSHALALALRPSFAAHTWETGLDDGAPERYLKGETFPANGAKGWYLICADGFSLGWGKLAGGVMKNHYPRGLRI